MRFLLYAALVSLCIVIRTSQAEELRCLGSDGGTPFINVSESVSTKQQVLHTRGQVKEFILHEDLNQIVYRNQVNQVHILNLSDSSDRFINYSNAKLSKITEKKRGRVLTSESTYYLDTANDSFWRFFAGPHAVKEHLFTQKGNIYSLEHYWQEAGNLLTNGKHHFSFLTLESENSYRRYCVAPGNIGVNLKWAKGNLYPYVYFTAVKPGLVVEDRVMVYRMAIDKIGGGRPCPIEEVTYYPYSKVGEVKSFYHFNVDGVDAFAFHLTDPKRNLFWDKPGECAYYNFKGKTPIFISPNHPVFATWRNGEGLGIHNLGDKTEMTLFKQLKQPSVGSESIWLSDNGKTIYSALITPNGNGEGRLIVSTKIKD